MVTIAVTSFIVGSAFSTLYAASLGGDQNESIEVGAAMCLCVGGAVTSAISEPLFCCVVSLLNTMNGHQDTTNTDKTSFKTPAPNYTKGGEEFV